MVIAKYNLLLFVTFAVIIIVVVDVDDDDMYIYIADAFNIFNSYYTCSSFTVTVYFCRVRTAKSSYMSRNLRANEMVHQISSFGDEKMLNLNLFFLGGTFLFVYLIFFAFSLVGLLRI